jgi:hypothetical protein
MLLYEVNKERLDGEKVREDMEKWEGCNAFDAGVRN